MSARSRHPHRRRNALTGEWVLASPQRILRPWDGESGAAPAEDPKRHDPECYLCPGVRRASGEVNPQYEGAYVFDNDFPALTGGAGSGEDEPGDAGLVPAGAPPDLFEARAARGTCRVICFSPRHDLTLSQLPAEAVRGVAAEWRSQFMDLIRGHRWVQIFENRGAMMGCSNPHPHGQIWASDFLPGEMRKEDDRQSAYLKSRGSLLLADYLEFEERARERIVEQNDDWTALTPYWAVWPFETMLLPRHDACDFADVKGGRLDSLATVLKSLLARYDRLFGRSTPYSMGWHCAPARSASRAAWRLHAHFYPPLLHPAVKKFMVGYEMLCEPQRDMTPEDAAARLREA